MDPSTVVPMYQHSIHTCPIEASHVENSNHRFHPLSFPSPFSNALVIAGMMSVVCRVWMLSRPRELSRSWLPCLPVALCPDQSQKATAVTRATSHYQDHRHLLLVYPMACDRLKRCLIQKRTRKGLPLFSRSRRSAIFSTSQQGKLTGDMADEFS